MTREEIAKSLKPIKWTYNKEFCIYMATLDVIGVRLRIEHESGNLNGPYLMAKTWRDRIVTFSGPFNTLDEAMGAARDILLDEACKLFEIDEQ
ncbi:hypothetical protein [Porphyromonas sp. oral taxon 278]|uniref:hypothetical protein n=1 Tax=Porphyromonas sp. oral taxon 278 TaxID=712437 RepID=UPI0025D3C295|nr:hypothetical protein [Porphyromonas sp. oral taxon 278]